MILVVAEQRGGRLARASWEAVAAAQSIADGDAITVVVPGAAVEAPASELASASVSEVIGLVHPALEPYTADGYSQALSALVGELAPSLVLLPHTYQTRDFAPALAARLGRALITDCTALRRENGRVFFTRSLFQGKLAADVVAEGETPHFATLHIGAVRADSARQGDSPAPVRQAAAVVDPA
ncbi:MAG TPA: hypothetical protein VNK41_05480, partial [Vicinamibacterales bacterium]|nr:hypothetical protein [Vicinamibacterales bacterium]